MSRITEELLRKSAEHNEGCVSTLEEITLHQRELVKIELLEVCCRHLKILYLQNNIIEKMEGLNKLKEVEYINLALNNISMIEGIEGCESLRKLDMTVNFIDVEDLEESLMNLQKLDSIRELFLTGNPCTDWKGYKQFVIATLPQLDSLDGTEIKKTEKIQAQQNYDELLVDLMHASEMNKIKKQKLEEEERLKEEEEIRQNGGVKKPRDPEEKCAYTKEVRREMYMEQAQQKEEKERQQNPKKYEVKEPSPMFRKNGEIRQCNEGKYKFKLREFDDPKETYFEMDIPKYLDTSLVDVNLNPKWISVRVRDKLTQLKLMDEVMIDSSKIQRSQITGQLSITCQKLHPDEILQSQLQLQKKEEEYLKREEQLKKEKLIKQQQETNKIIEKYEKKALEKKIDNVTFDDVPDLE